MDASLVDFNPLTSGGTYRKSRCGCFNHLGPAWTSSGVHQVQGNPRHHASKRRRGRRRYFLGQKMQRVNGTNLALMTCSLATPQASLLGVGVFMFSCSSYGGHQGTSGTPYRPLSCETAAFRVKFDNILRRPAAGFAGPRFRIQHLPESTVCDSRTFHSEALSFEIWWPWSQCVAFVNQS